MLIEDKLVQARIKAGTEQDYLKKIEKVKYGKLHNEFHVNFFPAAVRHFED